MLHWFGGYVIEDELRFNLIKAQQWMKKYADLQRREVVFEVETKFTWNFDLTGSKPLLVPPLRSLWQSFYGPYTILQWVPTVAYKLELPYNSKLHAVFHVFNSRELWKMLPYRLNRLLPIPLTWNEEVLDVRIVGRAARKITEVPIKWQQTLHLRLHGNSSIQSNSGALTFTLRTRWVFGPG